MTYIHVIISRCRFVSEKSNLIVSLVILKANIYFLILFIVSQEYIDYRFLKDLELKETRFCCCWRAKVLEIYSEDKDESASHRPEDGTPPGGSFAPHILKHPEAIKVEKIIRNAWTQARLVAD